MLLGQLFLYILSVIFAKIDANSGGEILLDHSNKGKSNMTAKLCGCSIGD